MVTRNRIGCLDKWKSMCNAAEDNGGDVTEKWSRDEIFKLKKCIMTQREIPIKNPSDDDVTNMKMADLVVDCRRKHKTLGQGIRWDMIGEKMVTKNITGCRNKWATICKSADRGMIFDEGKKDNVDAVDQGVMVVKDREDNV
uniref:Myb-like domain-containing protein n=2 Tax=Proboscia inermis TaxID=420281 RepID=A0A7S0GDP1_9STRA|mmetsp:Transcript_229/g.243  ORF Transcript_229/g.243 Transcript_229/m.243 type:complete len:142 (+) Transcript_229:225-650(+)|eukprot:CAMPEP_0171304068 /NCGR_PEP_ID=MMETSP0816-20121228/13730_1 /TAXON_ID=420281 /ORGANISM="Proboscia inermis, Strain CCAP1064/1" /LENGTH=141 /DNA_ID=CAMNT_0011783853 /DNA_START=34 /DNA_END=459 /DNA_ORIENTATION=+